MGWATEYIARLKQGETVQFRPRGHSMRGKIESGQLCTVEPVDSDTVQAGDVVLGIDGQPANSVDQVRSVVRGHPKSVALLIDREGQKIFVPVKLG